MWVFNSKLWKTEKIFRQKISNRLRFTGILSLRLSQSQCVGALYLVDLGYIGRFVSHARAGSVIVARVIVASVGRVEALGTSQTVTRER